MKPYIIGETAYHHEGNLNFLKRMIDEIADLQLDAIKYHLLLNPSSYMQKKHPLFKATKDSIFTRKQWDLILNYSVTKGLDIIALCDDIESVDYIITQHSHIAAVELHATSLNDYYMLLKTANFPGRIILGVSGSTIDEIDYAVNLIKNQGKDDILLMYGFQSYPTDYQNINLAKMLKLKDLFDLPVGYADHTAYNDENNALISAMAAAMGINILEKHYTPEPGSKRIDFHAAVGKDNMLKIQQLMQIYLQAYGDGSLAMSLPELKYGATGPMKKAIVARKSIKKGEKLSLDKLWFKRTQQESPLKQKDLLNLLDLEALCDIKQDEIIDYSRVKYAFENTDYSSLTGGLNKK